MPQNRFSTHSFDPDTLRVLYAAFDNVWKKIEPSIGAGRAEQARNTIADALIAMASSGQLDPDRLEVYALDQARKVLLQARA